MQQKPSTSFFSAYHDADWGRFARPWLRIHIFDAAPSLRGGAKALGSSPATRNQDFMAQDETPQDLMHYEAMAQDALRGVVRAALRRAAQPEGLPGAHHFYITFKTTAAGVTVPPDLLAKYPDEMTIVLQHQYQDLAPGETFFTVTLKFGGQPKRLSVPYAAVTRFYDPSVQFLLPFDVVEAPKADAEAAPPSVLPVDRPKKAKAEASAEAGEDEPKVVSLDQFRKK